MAEKRGMNERIQKLRELSVTTPVHIDLERAKIETDFYRENDGKYSIPVMRALVRMRISTRLLRQPRPHRRLRRQSSNSNSKNT